MITVKDIREKEFTASKKGYDESEVDEFLDALADQMEQIVRENAKLNQKLEKAESDLAQAQAAQPVQAAPVYEEPKKAEPAKDAISAEEETYFRDLQATVRETLISAQRIADETVSEARKKASLMVSAAEEQTNAMKAQSHQEVEAAKEEVETLKAAAADFRGRYLRMVQDQMAILKANDNLFAE